MALIYADTGTMHFSELASGPSAGSHDFTVLMLAGTGMILVGIGFKLALVPFHLWTPDVYEGAPAPVTAFIATVSKGAVFALLLRYFTLVPFHPLRLAGARLHAPSGRVDARGQPPRACGRTT